MLLEPSVPCCDICCPELLDRTRPGICKQNHAAQKIPFEKDSCRHLEDALDEWREEVFERDEPDSFLSPSSILPDEAIEKLAKLSRPLQRAHIHVYLSRRWPLWLRYGEDLIKTLLYIDATFLTPRSTTPTAPDSSSASANESRKRTQDPPDNLPAKRHRVAQNVTQTESLVDRRPTQPSLSPNTHFEQLPGPTSIRPDIRPHYRQHITDTHITPSSSTASSYYRPRTVQYATTVPSGHDRQSLSYSNTSLGSQDPRVPATQPFQHPQQASSSTMTASNTIPVAYQAVASQPSQQNLAQARTAAPADWTHAYTEYYYQAHAYAQAQAHAHAQYQAYLARSAVTSSQTTPSNVAPISQASAHASSNPAPFQNSNKMNTP